jgi:hypothetical protein
LLKASWGARFIKTSYLARCVKASYFARGVMASWGARFIKASYLARCIKASYRARCVKARWGGRFIRAIVLDSHGDGALSSAALLAVVASCVTASCGVDSAATLRRGRFSCPLRPSP